MQNSITLNFQKILQLSKQAFAYHLAPDGILASKVEANMDITDILNRFEKAHIPTVSTDINIEAFERWMAKYSKLVKFYGGYGEVRIEKILEHYLSMKYLSVSNKDLLIDVAASTSPFAQIVSDHLHNKTYNQDLIFEPGIHGNTIGGDAGNMPVPDQFADVLTLQCAFECFQGDDDINFILEAQRVLKKQGRLGIIPLYVNDTYFVKTGYQYDKRKVRVEEGAKWIWRDDNWTKEPFSRHYSPESFNNRIIKNIKNMSYKIIHFTNLDELTNKYPDQRIYCHFMFKAVKI